jgi:addiction module RelE/StbE family toxin
MPRALRNLQAIKEHIAQDAPRSAARFISRLKKAVGRLRDFPEAGWVLEDVDLPGYREIVVGNYRIVYQYVEKKVEVLTVFHGSRLLRERDLEAES